MSIPFLIRSVGGITEGNHDHQEPIIVNRRVIEERNLFLKRCHQMCPLHRHIFCTSCLCLLSSQISTMYSYFHVSSHRNGAGKLCSMKAQEWLILWMDCMWVKYSCHDVTNKKYLHFGKPSRVHYVLLDLIVFVLSLDNVKNLIFFLCLHIHHVCKKKKKRSLFTTPASHVLHNVTLVKRRDLLP